MGVWTWLDRYDAAALDAVGNPRARAESRAAIDTHRVWHAIHVALTGTEQAGTPPAAWVVGFASGDSTMVYSDTAFMHAPETVQHIADYLESVTLERATLDLRAAIGLGMVVYSYGNGDADMISNGSFADRFAAVKRFYRDAARARDAVFVHRV